MIIFRLLIAYFPLVGAGIGKTVKEKVCAHTSRDIRAIASQLVNVWLELYRKEKANREMKTLRRTNPTNISRIRRKQNSEDADSKENLSNGNDMTTYGEIEDNQLPMSEEEKAVFATAEAARVAAEAAAKASFSYRMSEMLNVFVLSEDGSVFCFLLNRPFFIC